jgi:periplasmic protein CpxP/Spy
MEFAFRRMLAAAAVLAACGFAIDSAGAQSDPQPTPAELQQRHWAEAGIDTQLKAMKTSLRLNADQETDWVSFETAVKAAEQARVLALQKEQGANLSPMERNVAKADRLAQSQTNLDAIVEAAKPLYASLDGAQKNKFVTLGRLLVPERGRFVKAMRRLSAR